LKICLVEMTVPTEKEDVEHIIEPAKVIPASLVQMRYVHLVFIIQQVWKLQWRMKVMRLRRMVGMNWIVVLKEVLIERIELIIFH